MNYNIKNDLLLIREYFQLSQEELASLLGVERLRIARVEAEKTYPRDEFLNKFYHYCYHEGLRLNIQKEMFYKDDIKKNHILLTHASKSEIIGNIDIHKGRERNDFGQGFYCGESYENAVSFVCRFPSSCIYFLDLNPEGLNKIEFDVNTNWMLAIAYFRGKLDNYKRNKVIQDIVEPVMKADYVIAPIADNRMFQIIDSFIEGEITDEQCKHCLSATNLGKQYVFLTNKAIDNLQILEKCFISDIEKEHYQKEQTEFQKIGNDKSKLARIQYKGKGKYIEEILI